MTTSKNPDSQEPDKGLAPFQPDGQPTPSQPSEAEQAKDARIAELEQQLAATKQQPSGGLSAAAKKAKSDYKVPAGEEGYHHVLITHESGVELTTPVVKAFEPHTYEKGVSKLPGFKGTIIHQAKK